MDVCSESVDFVLSVCFMHVQVNVCMMCAIYTISVCRVDVNMICYMVCTWLVMLGVFTLWIYT